MIYRIRPAKLMGDVTAPPSKSMAHRALICSALAAGESSRLGNIMLSADILATMEGVRALGAGAEIIKGSREAVVTGTGRNRPGGPVVIDCNESGSTLRFLIPVAAALGGEYIFTGRGRLAERPIGPYFSVFDKSGIEYGTKNGGLPLNFKGQLKPGDYELPGDISSQFISGLLLALPLLDGDSRVLITTELESAPYVDMTIEAQKSFGVLVRPEVNPEGRICYYINGKQKYKGTDCNIEGDYSQGAFWMVANFLGNAVNIDGLDPRSCQGDKAIEEILVDFAAGGAGQEEIVIDASQIPDLVPVTSVAAVFFKGRTRITNAGRLRIKESDRLSAVAEELAALGADIRELPEGLVINGSGSKLKGGRVRSHGDHRIAMSLAIAATACEGDVYLEDPGCVSKSYPDFWEVYRRIGGIADEFNLG